MELGEASAFYQRSALSQTAEGDSITTLDGSLKMYGTLGPIPGVWFYGAEVPLRRFNQ